MFFTFALHAGPNSTKTDTAIRLAGEAKKRGHEVNFFMMSEGVLNIALDKAKGLVDKGVKITVCDHNREELCAPDGMDIIEYGSQFDLAQFIAKSDRFLVFR